MSRTRDIYSFSDVKVPPGPLPLIFGIILALLATPLFGQGFPSEEHVMRLEPLQVGVAGELEFLVALEFDNLAANGIAGWAAAVCHPAGIVPANVVPGTYTATSNDGALPYFLAQEIREDGWYVGVVVNEMIDFFVAPGLDYQLHIVTYHGDTAGSFPLEFCQVGLVDTTVVPVDGPFQGQSLIPVMQGTDAVFDEVQAALFDRGDCNADTAFNLIDVMVLLDYLFLDGPRPGECLALCDFNEDGDLRLTDALTMLNGKFNGGTMPTGGPIDCNDAPTVTCGGGGTCP